MWPSCALVNWNSPFLHTMAIIRCISRWLVERMARISTQFCRPCNIWLWKFNFHNVDRHAEFTDKSWRFHGRIWSISESNLYCVQLLWLSHSLTDACYRALWEFFFIFQIGRISMWCDNFRLKSNDSHKTLVHLSHHKIVDPHFPISKVRSILSHLIEICR